MLNRTMSRRPSARGSTGWTVAGAAADPVAGTGDEVDRLRKRAPAEPADHHRAARVDRDLGGAAAAGEPHVGVIVGPHDGGVDVAEPVDLRAAEEAHLDPAVLE